MTLFTKTASILTTSLFLTGMSMSSLADWELDGERSTVQFMSVKNASVAELHHFRSITGGISDTGAAQVALDLDSVETLVPIRNQRMRELLFETVRFPAAILRAEVPKSLSELPVGETRDTAIEVEVDLHGAKQSYTTEVLVTRLKDGGLQVVISEPLLVKAADFGLADGIEVLREVAGLQSISTAVPVSGQLVFVPDSE
ncbi:YceI family protein [Congregibacter litoralis]|uniref:YceI-like domain protein n=1 Tax=Congregibacter litoralis KT71 TaxID=314285 RepID=A4A8W1_9GAMM|nr:YceI family protein [Congregibacter litoralis]EAQ97503.1 YceI-like domain protein [Congregibacter litoralis KT71]